MIRVSENVMEVIRFLKGVVIIVNAIIIIVYLKEIYEKIKIKEYGNALIYLSISVASAFAIFVLYKSM